MSQFIGKLNYMTEPYRLILADDHSVLRQELRFILEQTGKYNITGEAGDGQELLDLLKSGVAADALIMDLTMPKMSGMEALDHIRQLGRRFKVLVLTMHKEPDLICRSFLMGADGYLLKDAIAAELWTALQSMAEDKIYVSPPASITLPDTCRIKAIVGQRAPSILTHCGRNSSEPI
jgi:DNA-binding NarL/FixJ family response regulator